jgi:hypothetical protein
MNRYYGHIYNNEQMLNKNVADFTNFDGKTNKRIVQAPGGDGYRNNSIPGPNYNPNP